MRAKLQDNEKNEKENEIKWTKLQVLKVYYNALFSPNV